MTTSLIPLAEVILLYLQPIEVYIKFLICIHEFNFIYLNCRLLSEYLGVETMLAIVCRSYEGVLALEMYDDEGDINKSSGVHGLGAPLGRLLDGRFSVICLESVR